MGRPETNLEAYTVAIGDAYLALSTRTLAITRFYNPDLPITVFYAHTETSGRLLEYIRNELRIKTVLTHCNKDRWSINYHKWQADLTSLGICTYLYLDSDAFIVGKIPDEIPLGHRYMGICHHPNAKFLVRRGMREQGFSHWSNCGGAAYYIPHDKRSTYNNAGVALFTYEGMVHFRNWLSIKLALDESRGYGGSSPYFDEAYVNRYTIVDHPERLKILPPQWNQFHKITYPPIFNICHLVGHGSGRGFSWMMTQCSYLLEKWEIVDPISAVKLDTTKSKIERRYLERI